MNEYSKELCHWALGKKAKDHKYVAREDGKKKGQYLYFYDISKWKNWKDKVATATKKVASNFASDWKSGAGMIKTSAKEYGKLWKQGVGLKTKEEKRMEPRYDKPIGPRTDSVGPTQRMTNQADQHVSDVANFRTDKFDIFMTINSFKHIFVPRNTRLTSQNSWKK